MKVTKTTLKSICLSAVAGALTMGTAKAQDTEFKPSSNLWGYVFSDYYVKAKADSLGRGAGNVTYKGQPANQSSFALRRAYIGWDYNFAKNFSTQIVLANELSGSQTSTGSYQNTDALNQNTTYVKYAYLKWANIFPMGNLIIGQQPTSSFASYGQTEQLWGYRSVERTIMDLHNFDSSTDMGLGLNGKAWQGKGDSTNLPMFVGYNFMVGNNLGAKNQVAANTYGTSSVPVNSSPQADPFNSYKKLRGNIFASFLNQHLMVGVYADYIRTQLSPYVKANSTSKVYANYSSKWFSVGAEYFMQTNKYGDYYLTNVSATSKGTKDSANTVQTGVSVFASGTIIPGKLNIYARMDVYNPDTKYNNSNVYTNTGAQTGGETGAITTVGSMTYNTFYKQTLYIAGLDYTPNARVHIMPNVWVNNYETLDGSYMASSGAGYTSKNYTSTQNKGQDLMYRVTFYYLFNSAKKVSNNGRDF